MLPFVAAAVGLSVIGAGISMFGASSANSAQKNIAKLEMQAEEQRKKAMELDASRRRMEVLRAGQQASSLAVSRAANQGASSSTGIFGGLAQIAGRTGFNTLGIDQNLMIGRNMFGINQKISQQKMELADAQMWSSIGSSISGVGSSIMGNLGGISRLSGGYNAPGGGYGYNTYGGQISGGGFSGGIY